MSLKEGLFTNANVLFKARFRDGTSIVEVSPQQSLELHVLTVDQRTERRSQNAMYEDKENAGDGAGGKGKRGAATTTARAALAAR